jgi:hypothetical protein
MPHAVKTADPIAALLDACVDAQHAGCAQSDVDLLQDIGDDIARFACELTDKLMKLSDGRMTTRHVGNGERRAKASFEAAEVAELMAEAIAADLDQFSVIRAALKLRFGRAGIGALRRVAA